MHAICIETSHRRGMGHLFRAVSLIREMRAHGVDCMVVLNDDPASVAILGRMKIDFQVAPILELRKCWEEKLIKGHRLAVWINDRLDTDFEHASKVKHLGVDLVTFDDRGSGAALADLHFAGLVFDRTYALQGRKVFRGIDYLVLNPDIDRFRRNRTQLGSILVTLGGTDTYGVTVKVVELLAHLGRSATVVLGPGFEHRAELERVLSSGFVVKTSVPSLVEEFSGHDLAVTGGGITPFEANAAGLPCLTISSEPFELAPCRFLAGTGGSIYLGHASEITGPSLGAALQGADISAMSAAGLASIGTGGALNVVSEILKL